MIPGPVEIAEDVLREFSGQPSVHYGPEWTNIYKTAQKMLNKLLRNTGLTFIMPGSGSLAVEAICATFCRDRRLLVASNGWFGDRVYAICSSYNDEAKKLGLPTVIPADPNIISRELKNQKFDALFMVHVETTTATLNPLKEIGAVAKEQNVDFFVDGVSSVGIEEIDMDNWGIGALAAASQKGLECLPGLGIVAVSQRLLERARNRKGYWFTNLGVWLEYYDKWNDWHPFPVTVPTNTIKSLKRSLQNILDIHGTEARTKMFENTVQVLRNELSELGVKPLGSFSDQCNGLTACNTEGDYRPSKLIRYLLSKHGIRVAGTLGTISESVFRIGHMSSVQCSRESVTRTIAGIDDFLKNQVRKL